MVYIAGLKSAWKSHKGVGGGGWACKIKLAKLVGGSKEEDKEERQKRDRKKGDLLFSEAVIQLLSVVLGSGGR